MREIRLVALQFVALIAVAQTVQYPTSNVYLSAGDAQAILIPPSTASTLAAFTVDNPGAAGDDLFDVLVDDPQVIISLILPNKKSTPPAPTAQNPAARKPKPAAKYPP
jgi:hypothetical protein